MRRSRAVVAGGVSRNFGVDTSILTRAQLAAGTTVPGPAVIHQANTTTVIGAGFAGRTDAHGNLILTAAA
jgi:N-methylhydantoinase A/oxoprolinase/acetone carboxylase beta subunit